MTSSNPRLLFMFDLTFDPPLGNPIASAYDVKLSASRITGQHGRSLHKMNVGSHSLATSIRAVNQTFQSPESDQNSWYHPLALSTDESVGRKTVELTVKLVSLC